MRFIRRGELKETSLFKEAIWQMEGIWRLEKEWAYPALLNREFHQPLRQDPAMDLHNAMRRGQIQLFYQPQITAQDTLHGLKR